MEKHTGHVMNANATAALAPVAAYRPGTGSTMVVLHSVADVTKAANIKTLNRV